MSWLGYFVKALGVCLMSLALMFTSCSMAQRSAQEEELDNKARYEKHRRDMEKRVSGEDRGALWK